MINGKEAKCNRFDEMFNDLTMVSSIQRQFPTNSDEFIVYCKKNNELANQIGQMIKVCFNDTMRNIASLVLYSYRSRTKLLCKNKNGKRAKEYLEAGPCLNQYQGELSRCIDLAANKIGIVKTKPNNLKFPHLCCESVHFQRCINKIQAGECKNKISIFAESAQSILNGFVDRSCGEYNAETDKCDQLAPIVVKKDLSKPSFVRNVAELLASI